MSDPANAAFIGAISRGEVPRELEQPGNPPLNVSLVRSHEEYQPPKYRAFGGTGRTLAGARPNRRPGGWQPPGLVATAEQRGLLCLSVLRLSVCIGVRAAGSPWGTRVSGASCPPVCLAVETRWLGRRRHRRAGPGASDVCLYVCLCLAGDGTAAQAPALATSVCLCLAGDGTAAQAPAPATSSRLEVPWEGPDERKPTTSIQLRLHDGSRLVAKWVLALIRLGCALVSVYAPPPREGGWGKHSP
jgi:SEP domain